MAKIPVNPGDHKDTSTIPAGDYSASIVTAEVRAVHESRAVQGNELNVGFRIEGENYNGKRLWNSYPLNPDDEFHWTFTQFLTNMFGRQAVKSEWELDTDDLIDSPVLIKVTESTSKDGTRKFNNIRQVMPSE